MSKRVVISGYYGFKNFGDEAILSLLVNKLTECNSDITVITSNPDYTNSLYSNVNTVKTFDFANIIHVIKSSDILISGGGSLLQDVTSLKSLIYYLLIIFIALFFRKKVIIFAQGIGPINNKAGQLLAKNILKHCTYISVRDSQSVMLLNDWGIKSDIVCDPVFSLPVIKKTKSKILGVQLRNTNTMNNNFLNNLAELITNEFDGYIIEIYSLQDSLDFDICNRFKELIEEKTDVRLYNNMTHNEVTEHINTCEYLIGMRFHSLIIGLLSGVKTMAINYDIKVKKLSQEFNLPLTEIDNIDKESIVKLKNEDLSATEEALKSKNFDWDKILYQINN